ncbi:C39 family peptidase [Cohnella suwonensis]|uniref:C39 family peptidase n=1 Tax=Cohnella suwonensis TaxID=696072 RepID=A0ABW0LRF0_9BACL
MGKLVYYSQEDRRWAHLLYSNRRDPEQTIATSGCGPTCFAMAVSSLTDRELLPPEAADWSVKHGYRTPDNGTDWFYFEAAAKAFGVSCKRTGNLQEVKAALESGALVIASMGKGHMTGAGHYVLMVGINGKWIDVLDPNPDNIRYGADGLIDQGVKNDGRIKADEIVFKREARQYWIINRLIKEEDEPMTKEEKQAFDAMREDVAGLKLALEAATKKIKAPAWFIKEFGSADLGGKIHDPRFSEEGWRVLAVGVRLSK